MSDIARDKESAKRSEFLSFEGKTRRGPRLPTITASCLFGGGGG